MRSFKECLGVYNIFVDVASQSISLYSLSSSSAVGVTIQINEFFQLVFSFLQQRRILVHPGIASWDQAVALLTGAQCLPAVLAVSAEKNTHWPKYFKQLKKSPLTSISLSSRRTFLSSKA